MPDRDRLAGVAPDGVRIEWTIDDQIEARDGRSNMLLMRCGFKQHWACLTRDQKKRLLRALMVAFLPTMQDYSE